MSEDAIEEDDMCQWSQEGDNMFFPAGKVTPEIPPGIYNINDSMRGVYFQTHDSDSDDLIELPNTQSAEILEYVRNFWGSREAFQRYGYMWKRGILLWGPPGSGKSSTINMLNDEVVKEGGVVVYMGGIIDTISGLTAFRNIEPERPLVVIIEDIEEYMRWESTLLALLDGEYQIDNVLFIATTNHPEQLPPRLVNRPSRFDVIQEIGMPGVLARLHYIQEVIGRAGDSVDNIEEWVAKTEGMGMAHVKDVIISVRVFGMTLDQAVERMHAMMAGNLFIGSEDDDDTPDASVGIEISPELQEALDRAFPTTATIAEISGG